MRNYKRILGCLMAAAMLLSGAPALASTPAEAADTLFTNGYIYTVDAADTVAQALAVKDGKIIFVGTDEDAQAYKGDSTQVVDLEGKMMLPGLIDSHLHSVTPAFFDFSLLGITTLDETLAAIEKYVTEHPEKEIYNGFGYSTSVFEGEEAEKGPRKERLDAIVADKPITILSYDGHASWANSKFFEVHGITGETESPRGGILEKDEATGDVWGTLKDSAIALGGDTVYDPDTLIPALKDFEAMLNSYGYTTIMTLPAFGTMPVPFDAYLELENAGELTLRVHGATSVMDWSKERDIARVLESREKYNTELVKMNTAKFFMDGVVDARSAFMLEPYNDVDSTGISGWDLEDLGVAFAELNEAGVQLHSHAIGDAALRLALDALEYAKANAPEGDYRNAITHLQVVNEADIPRLGALDVFAVAQPFWHYKAPAYWDVVETTAIGERAVHMYPMKSFKDTGAVIVSSSDYPVTSDPNPFVAMEVGVTRNLSNGMTDLLEYGVPPIEDMDDPTYLLWPEERLTIAEMIRSYTADAARLVFAEDETGTLEVGKAADLIVLDQNLLEVDPLQIHATHILQTYFNGKLVYEQ